jgi:hypothetical protein
MQIGAADAARLDRNQDLAGSGSGTGRARNTSGAFVRSITMARIIAIVNA